MSAHGQGPEHEAYAMGCHCNVCRPVHAHNEETWRRYMASKEAVMAGGYVGGPFTNREEYETWIRENRERAQKRRNRNWHIASLIVTALIVLVTIFVVLANAEAVPVRMSQAVEAPKERGDLEVAREHCENAGGEWFEDDRSAIMIPGTKVVGCFWIVPKDMK